jgi:NADH-quinone oxidoreductase subunit I
MDKVFELGRRERFDALLQRKSELAKSNTYYHRIHPTEAAEVDANLAAAAAKKKPTPAGDAWCRSTYSETAANASDIVSVARRWRHDRVFLSCGKV